MFSSKHIRVTRYTSDREAEWDRFVDDSVNGHLFVRRLFLDHQSRLFDDRSVMIWKKRRLIGVLPMCAVDGGDAWQSHVGAPFSGLVHSSGLRHYQIEAALDQVVELMNGECAKRLVVTQTPPVYQLSPCENLPYALLERGAVIASVKAGQGGLTGERMWSKRTRTAIRSAGRDPRVTVDESTPLHEVRPLLEETLVRRHGAALLHQPGELEALDERIPGALRVITARMDGHVISTEVVLRVTGKVWRLQGVGYVEGASGEIGQRAVFHHLHNAPDYHGMWLDKGTSNDPATGRLDPDLFFFKESSGSHLVPITTYSLTL